MAIHRVILLVSVTLALTFSSCSCAVTTTENPVDIRTGAKQLVRDIHTAVTEAKYGRYIDLLFNDVLDIEVKATQLLEALHDEVSECETNLVIKMAAAGTGSHEVLTLMLAQNQLSVLDGRLALSLAFLEHLAGQLEDELTQMSSDIGPQLSAIAFGANVTADVIDTADQTVKAMVPSAHPNINNNDVHNRVRRQFNPNVSLGGGWSVGLGGVKWQSGSGRYTFNAKPTFSGFKPSGVKATFTIKF